MPPRTLHIAAACLFDETGRLLLVRKRGTHRFMLPGGKRDEGETAMQTLLRELHEELQLRVPESAFTPLGHFSEVAANEANTRVEADIFSGMLPHPVHPAAELEELRWLSACDPRTDDLAPLLRRHVLPLLWPSA
ncbi:MULTISPECIES: NUDIX domain-containing protein [Pseudomonas]|uniref:NUDIX hydrolase n=2 Tax=Pseudomonadaceae TaxID=135621 RepID=A0A0D0KJY2_9PSED|nr:MULTISPECIES: NUDIX domain-containing protein [Pseudomonas]KIP99687.1 NUDIX hydrolase [Pseudomonas fulva]MCW2291737.1 8-oxo-dGTP pyrophosphatase MutT (NUDIX family) [Pseudomonas sp. BIGb0408]NYH73692.1 8-oxo-dGTP pyrophosphatase MutT (NUDIX family) [Pseudomonas flavescens]